MLIFVLQSIWLYIKELAGKDLDIEVIFKFLIYVTPKLIPLVLPLTILLASIMVFGSFAENYEFAAMKSTGISLQRAMSGLSIFIVGIGIITFFFANNAIPWSEMKFYNLRKNIAKTKPSMAIVEGQFNQIESTPYNIKVENKSGDNDQYLEDITIHLKGADGRTNAKTIKAKTGEFLYDESSDNLQLILFDGNYYQDLSPKDIKSRNKKPFTKGTFEKDIINIDLSQLNNVDFDDESKTDKYNMLDIVGLDTTLDSLAEKHYREQKGIARNLYTRSSITKLHKATITSSKTDSINTISILNVFDTKNKSKIVEATLKSITSSKKVIDQKIKSFKTSKIWFNKHIISFHDKFALGFACIILFFVGAPLGALIRKGGIGLPMVIAILLFLSYHFIGIFATNSGKSGDFNPILASWFSTLIMLPLSIFLTKRATADRGLFETDGVLEPLKKLFGLKKEAILYDTSSKEYGSLNKTDNQKLEETIRLKNKYEEDTNLTVILYAITVVLVLGGSILKNNTFPLIGNILFIPGIIIGVIYLFSLIKSFLSSSYLNKHLGKETISNAILFLLLGLPLYFINHLYQKRKINEELNLKHEK